MRVLPESPEAIAEALRVLAAGGSVAHATETCYGLACDLSNPDAVAKLFRVKARPETQPVSALFPSVEEAKRYVEWNDEAERLARQHLPGPLTLILPLKQHPSTPLFPTPVRPGTGQTRNQQPTVGIRVSPHPVAQELARRFGKPISTTSANVHAQPNPYSAGEIARQFADAKEPPDLIIDGGALPERPPSSVVDLSQNDKKIVRRAPLQSL